jgi:hypothetical protein
MTRPTRCGYLSLPFPKDWGRCVLCANLRYNRANETAAEEHDGHSGGYREASMKRGQLVSRRSRQSQRLCPSSLLRIESP